ncbi:hypothetical protein DFH05DRAFT_977246 [Lentinula detonsa]|uniref:Uncharacterized protein n=1 Tax=Lentinula detonsa TaxID=2804962 RepID=A0A9W8P4D3_9AGAR|nr:hypothetical protein DFH05DRAFT_977246 [Lentinula detonsa]
MSKPTFFRNLWRRVWNPTGFVGKDLEGNSYYERSNPLSNAGYSRSKRSVTYRNQDDMWNYIGGSKRLPTHTRTNPPSVQELQMDLIRQHRVQHNAALIEASFQQERAQLRLQDGASSTSSEFQPSQIQDPLSNSTANSASSSSPSLAPKVSPAPPSESKAIPNPESSPGAHRPATSLPKTGSDEWQPESWAPKLRIRRG